MNKSYALVWNQAAGCWNVASEWARRRGKGGRSKAVLAAGISLLGVLCQAPAYALPTGAIVVAGDAGLHTSADGKQMTIYQQSNKLITNWNTFNVAGDERVSFQQPSQNSIALNRVIGNQGSDIQGRIDANGKVFLVNPNGVVFGKSAQVNVGSLVASTQDIADKDFLTGNYRFTGDATTGVSNNGSLVASQGGSVALLGAQVSNNGVIRAQLGGVVLGAGNDFSVNFDSNGLINLQVTRAALNALAHNGGLLNADGGQVLMTAKSAGGLLQTVVSNQGVVEARTLQNKAGKIILEGGNSGTVLVAGRQDASALSGQGNGGTVENLGAKVEVQLAAQVDTRADAGTTGKWKIRSNDVVASGAGQNLVGNDNAGVTNKGNIASSVIDSTIGRQFGNSNGTAGSGGNLIGQQSGSIIGSQIGNKNGNSLANSNTRSVSIGGSITSINGGNVSPNGNVPTVHSDTLSKNLANTNIELASSQGNLSVEAPISWNSSSTLGLTSERGNVQVNGALNASGANSGVQLNAKQGSIQINENIALTGAGSSLELNQRVNNGHSIKDGKAVTLSGDDATFRVNGQSYDVVQNLDQLRKIGDNMAGRYVLGNAIKGTGSFEAIGDGAALTGVLDGLGNAISDLSIHGSAGGVGLFAANAGQINNLNLERISVDGGSSPQYNTQVGTLAGINLGTIQNVKANEVQVTGSSYLNSLGGLVGVNLGGTIGNSSVRGQVTGNQNTFAMGGLVGENVANANGMAQIINSRANTLVTGQMAASTSYYGNSAGGLVGLNEGGSIANSSSQGSVNLFGDNLNIGGLVGHNIGNISNAQSSASVSGGKNSLIGGLVGLNRQGSIANSSASGQVKGSATQAIGGLVGKNLANTLSNVSATGYVSDAYSGNVGGLVGNNAGGVIANATVSGTISGGNNANVGGLVGSSAGGSITNATASSTVTGGNNAIVGGLVGYSRNTAITNATNFGTSVGGMGSTVGGLVGNLSGGRVDNSHTKGSVSGAQSSRVGGLAGMSSGQISTSSASTTVEGGDYANLGGLVAVNTGSVMLSSASGKVDFKANSGQVYGGLIGQNFGQQNLNSVSGAALGVPAIGRNFRF